jgi:metallophosphoesterase (TIGR03767 family)
MRAKSFKLCSPAVMLMLASGLAGVSIGTIASAQSSADKTTLANIITGASNQSLHGYRKLVKQQNTQGRVIRTLDGSAAPGDLVTTVPLLAIGHMSDTQICDDQSPARVPFMDKRFDIDQDWDTGSAYRPQERLLPQMAAAMVSSLRNLGTGPATGLPLAFTLITGDMIDNAQYNETRWYIDLMDGGLIRPNNWVNPSVDEGPGYGRNDTSHKNNLFEWWWWSFKPSAYYHPDGAVTFPGSSPPDWYRQHDFPVIPALRAASRRNFTSPGLGMPWYAAFGNHDMSIQGNLPADSTVGNWAANKATQAERIREVDAPWEMPSGTLDWVGAIGGALLSGNPTYETTATADPNRRLLDKSQFMDEHFVTSGWPIGHGFDSTGRPYYVKPSSGPNDRFKFIALDTTNDNGFGAGGWIDGEQWTWLFNELKAASTKYWAPDGSGWIVNPAGKDKLIVLYGHHTLDSMNKITKVNGIPQGYTGTELRTLLLRFPNVIMLVNGHTHSNSIKGHWATNRQGRYANYNGFWEVTSPSASDFPVQSRAIEVALNSNFVANGVRENNYLSIYTTMLDIDAPVTVDPYSSLTDFRQLAGVGRELAFNDPGDLPLPRMKGWRSGEAWDRNTQLLIPTPFGMNDYPAQGERGTHIVMQKWDTRDVKILKVGINGNYLSTVDLPAASVQNSEVIGTGQFVQGLKMGQDLVLRDTAGNIRIKLLDWHLNEVSYPGFGEEVRGTVAATTTLGGIGDFNGDGRSDLLWRRANGLSEVWFAGSSADQKYLQYDNDNSNPVPPPGSEDWKIMSVGDFNADGYSDILFENSQNHMSAIWYMNGAVRIGDSYPPNWQYNNGFDVMNALTGNVLEGTTGDRLLYRKMNTSPLGQLAVAYPHSNSGTALYYQNVNGWNTNLQWQAVGLGDFNLDGTKDILWRHMSGYFAIWLLNNTRFAGETAINIPAVNTEWKVRGLLRNTMYVIY